MTVFHLKPIYLNWRVIHCRRRKSCIYAIFFFDIFLNLAFLIFVWIRSNFSSAWYDNQILFFAFIFCFYSYDFPALSNNACHSWPSRLKHHFAYENCFEKKKVVFWSKGLFMSFLSAKKGYGSKGCSIPFLSTSKGCRSNGCSYHFCQ